jgi:hypothetical protein
VQGFLAAHAFPTIHCLVRKAGGPRKAAEVIRALRHVFQVALIDEKVIGLALDAATPDFEDAVTAAAAALSGRDLIVTRDPKGFRDSIVPCLAPEAALCLFPSARN